MSPDDRAFHDKLVAMPPTDRLVALTTAVIDEERNAFFAVAALIALVKIMAGYMTREQRAAVAWLMANEASELINDQWH